MTYWLLVALFALAQVLIVTPARSELQLWHHFAGAFWTDPVLACQAHEPLAFGGLPWTGNIHPYTEHNPDDVICTYTNLFDAGPKYNVYCRNDDDTITPGACKAPETCEEGCPTIGEKSASQKGNEKKGNPASLSSGHKYEFVTDWASPRDSRFKFVRSYRPNFSSLRDMGLVWQSNWSDQLRLLPAQGVKIRLVRSNGDWQEFVDLDGDWNNPTGNWQRTNPDTAMTMGVRHAY